MKFKQAERQLTLVLFVAVFATSYGCGKGGDSPTAPSPQPTSPATPTATGLTITGLDAIRSGFFASFTAQATMSDATTQTVTAAWSTGNGGVATVATNGDVTGVSNGIATITASYQGRTASRSVRVVSNFGGAWTGNYRINKCDQTAGFAGWCQGLGGVGAVLPLGLNLIQGGNSRDLISGTISLGTITGNTSGNVTGDGRLILGGTFTNTVSGGTVFVIEIGGWDTRLSGASGMTGGWSQSIRANGFPGNAYQENQLSSLTHTSNGSSVSGVRDVVSQTFLQRTMTGQYAMPLDQFFQHMRGQ